MTPELQNAIAALLQAIVPPLATFLLGWFLPQPKGMQR